MQLDNDDSYKGVRNLVRDRLEIDKLLEQMSKIQSNLGLDSTSSEKAEAKKKQNELMRLIRAIDPEYFKEIAPDEFPKLNKSN